MLIAELHGKLKADFACGACGSEDANLEAAAAVEDALTSTYFGALRWMRPELGLLPLLHRAELPVETGVAPTLLPWPFRTVPMIPVGERDPVEIGCEPDICIDAPGTSFLLVEVKLGAVLGADPLQLPKEAVVAHLMAAGRPWRLLCVTPGVSPPAVPSFTPADGVIAIDGSARLPEAVASYFRAAAALGAAADYPTPEQVERAVSWLPWSALGAMLESARARETAAPHEALLIDDVVALLRKRGLIRPVFHGFHVESHAPLPWPSHDLWRRPADDVPLWAGMNATVEPWSAMSWLHARAGSGFGAFDHIPAGKPEPWPKMEWLAGRSRRRR